MKSIVILVLVGVSLQLGHAAPADKVDCSKLDEVLEDLGGAQSLTTMFDKYKLQSNAEEHAKRCTEMSDAIKTLRKYNRDCYKALTHQIFSAILKTRTEYNDKYCKDPASQEYKDAIEAAKCIVEQSFESTKAAELKTIKTFQTLYESNIADEKLRIRRACCAVNDSKKFFLEGTKDKCSKFEKIYEGYVDSYTSEAMGYICPEADKLECGKLSEIKIDGVTASTKCFLSPMLKLVKTLDH